MFRDQGSPGPSARAVQKESMTNQSFWDKIESVLVTGWCALCLLPVVVGVEAAQRGWWLSRWREAGLCSGAEACPGLSGSPLVKEELPELWTWSGREMWVVGTSMLLREGLIQGQGRKTEQEALRPPSYAALEEQGAWAMGAALLPPAFPCARHGGGWGQGRGGKEADRETNELPGSLCSGPGRGLTHQLAPLPATRRGRRARLEMRGLRFRTPLCLRLQLVPVYGEQNGHLAWNQNPRTVPASPLTFILQDLGLNP